LDALRVLSGISQGFSFMNITKALELDETVPVDFEWKGFPVHLDVYKHSLTPGFLEDVEAVKDYPKAIIAAVKDWNVDKDDEGNKLPLTIKELRKIPVPFFSEVFNQIASTWAGDAKKQNASDNGSVAAAS